MIKTMKNLLKQDKERYTVPRKVQDVIPVRRIWKDGIFQVGSRFSKTYQFTDINYLVASREDKEQMFLAYSELLNSLDSGATTKITINNRRLNRANFEQSILMPMTRLPAPTASFRRNISRCRSARRTSKKPAPTLPGSAQT